MSQHSVYDRLTLTAYPRPSDEVQRALNTLEASGMNRSESVKFRLMADPESGWLLAVRQYAFGADTFNEFRTGLDHFAFGVATRAELEAWETELSRRDIPFSPINDTPIGSVIVFRDPDNIQLEFWLSPA